MPPKPELPPEDMLTRHERGVQLETTVRGLLHHKAVRRAHRIFDQEWELTILPHLPLRYGFELDQLQMDGVKLLIDRDSANYEVTLSLKPKIDPHHPERIAVLVVSGSKREVLGFLSPDAQGVLEHAGEHRSLYEVKPLHISGLEAGDLQFQMELVRPDLRQCSSCGALHTDDQVNCEECRSKRRRKQKTLEETAEQAPVPMQGALRALGAEPDLTL